jgi:RNase P subunit RPR2
MSTYRQIEHSSSRPYYSKIGCSICKSTKPSLIIAKTTEHGWMRGDDTVTFTCRNCSKGSKLWVQYDAKQKQDKDNAEKEHKRSMEKAINLIRSAYSIDISTDEYNSDWVIISVLTKKVGG